MIRYVLRFRGLPIFTVDTIHYELIEEDEESPAIGGGSAHNFERDTDPLSPDDRYDWPWEGKGFGFRGQR